MIITLDEALSVGRGTERSFNCPSHEDANASASVNVAKGVWYCPSPDVRLLTADLRWQAIGTMKVGDTLVGFDERVVEQGKRQWRTATVEQIETITQPCYDITLDDGRIIRASAGHQWLVEVSKGGHRQWRTTRELVSRNGGYCKIMTVAETWKEEDDYEAGYLAAAFDGEGSLLMRDRGRGNGTREVRLLFYQKPNAMLDEVERCLRVKGFRYGKYLREDGCYHLLISRKEDVLRFLGQIRPKRLLEKFSPDLLGGMSRLRWAKVVGLDYVENQPVIAMKTSTGTYVAEGLASHNCYVCHAHGETKDHVPTVDEALSILAGTAKARVYPEAWLDLFDADHVSPYWFKRYGMKVAAANRCGTDPETNSPTYPLRDAEGRLCGVVSRHEDLSPKYSYPWNSSTSRTLYGPHRAAKVVVLVEGASDVMAVEQSGIPKGWSVNGCFGSGIHYPQVELVARMAPDVIVAAFNDDRAGLSAIVRACSDEHLLEVAPVLSHRWSSVGANDAGSAPTRQRTASLRQTLTASGYGALTGKDPA